MPNAHLSLARSILARSILGGDFITPEKIMERRKDVVYTDEQLLQFNKTVPPQKVLGWCRNNNYMLVAGPNRPMSLLEIRNLQSDYFLLKDGGWYAEHSFAKTDTVGVRWITLRKEPLFDSVAMSWHEQRILLSKDETVPNVAEVIWCMTTYKAIRNISLFPDISIQTSSLVSDGRRVNVGRFSDGGLWIRHHSDNHRHPFHGLAPARKLR